MRPSRHELSKDCTGAVSTEYLLLVGLVGLPLAALLLAMAPAVTDHYEQEREVLSRPYP